jgi:hypothetical protein
MTGFTEIASILIATISAGRFLHLGRHDLGG